MCNFLHPTRNPLPAKEMVEDPDRLPPEANPRDDDAKIAALTWVEHAANQIRMEAPSGKYIRKETVVRKAA